MNASGIKERVLSGILISFLLLGAYSAPARGHFAITYFDNYNYDTGQWDAWQSVATPLDAWDDKYLADGLSGNTVFTDHAFDTISTFDLRGDLWSKDGHDTGGEDWNPLQSNGDNVSGQSVHHVFAALFKGLIYLEEGDELSVASDDDVYVFLDEDTAWGQEVLSIPYVSFFDTDSVTVTAAQAGYHVMTVKFIERLDSHSGIEITLNGEHLQNAEVVIDIKPGSFPNSINLANKGVTPVAILTGDGFDATLVDPASIQFAGASPLRWAHEDVDGDGDIDLIFHFKTQELDLNEDSTSACLTGKLLDETPINGCDSVRIVPPKK